MQGGNLQITEYSHRDGARNRRCRHHQHVWECTFGGFQAQRIALFNAEAVLLVDDHETEGEKLHGLLNDRMRTDDNIGLARDNIKTSLESFVVFYLSR